MLQVLISYVQGLLCTIFEIKICDENIYYVLRNVCIVNNIHRPYINRYFHLYTRLSHRWRPLFTLICDCTIIL